MPTGRDPNDAHHSFVGYIMLSEREIMRLLVEGLSLADIDEASSISSKTIANVLSHIKAKLEATRTDGSIRLAMTLGVA